MSITNIIILIIILLIVSVVASIIFTKKEQAASLRRQQVASYRYKADEAQDLYDGLQSAGLEKIAYKFLLDRIIANLQAAYDIDPKAPGINHRLTEAKKSFASFDTIQFYIQMPSAMTELHGLIARLNKLIKYLVVLYQKKAIQEHLYAQLMPSIQRTALKFDAEGHMKMGHQAANDGQAGTAKQSYLHAKDKLLSFGIEDAYVEAQLEKVEELIQSLEEDQSGVSNDKSESVTYSENSMQTLDSDQDDGDVLSQEEINQQSSEPPSSGFEEKKKW